MIWNELKQYKGKRTKNKEQYKGKEERTDRRGNDEIIPENVLVMIFADKMVYFDIRRKT